MVVWGDTDATVDPVDSAAFIALLKKELLHSPSPATLNDARARALWGTSSLPNPSDRIACCQVLAQADVQASRFAEAHGYVRLAYHIAGSKPALVAEADYVHGIVLNRERRLVEALPVLESSLRKADDAGNITLKAKIATLLAGVNDDLGNAEATEELYFQALVLREQLGDPHGLAVTYYNYAELCVRRDDIGQALEYFMRSLELEQQLDDRSGMAQTACQIAMLMVKQDNTEAALAMSHTALGTARSVGVPALIAYCLANHATVVGAQGNPVEHRRAVEEAIAYTQPYGFSQIIGPLYGNLGELLLAEGDLVRAESYLQHGLAIIREDGYRFGEGTLLLTLGRLKRQQGSNDEAEPILREAARLFHDVKAHGLELDALLELARTAAATGATRESSEWMISWASAYREEHDAAVKRKLDHVQRRLERERRAKEDEINRLKYVELSSAMEQLRTVNIELQELAAEKDEFMAIAAHDLRNPLSDMRLMLQSIMSDMENMDKADLLSACRDLLLTTSRMISTVHTFLEISRNDRRSKDLNDDIVDLGLLLQRARERHRTRADAKGITIIVHVPVPVWAAGDASIIDAVLDNLVSNALKFSPPASSITLRADADDHTARFCVMDEGPGISPTDETLLFTKYTRLSAQPTAGEDSLGLGLYLAKRMAERINGRLVFDRAYTAGSCFILELPLIKQ